MPGGFLDERQVRDVFCSDKLLWGYAKWGVMESAGELFNFPTC